MKHTMFHVPIFCYRFINWSDKFKKEILSQLELSPLKKNNRIQTDYNDIKENCPPYKGFVVSCVEDKLNDFCKEINMRCIINRTLHSLIVTTIRNFYI